jgi:hypothetical protein
MKPSDKTLADEIGSEKYTLKNNQRAFQKLATADVISTLTSQTEQLRLVSISLTNNEHITNIFSTII